MDVDQISFYRLAGQRFKPVSSFVNTIRRTSPALLILLLIAWGIRVAVMGGRFHVDEALYATHARAASEGDFMLLAFDVDKPPLSVYLTALSFALLGVSEFAARVPNLLASALGLAVVWALARRVYEQDRTAFFAVLLVALSPYDVLFAPTVFAEPQVVLWGLLACWAVTGGRWMWAGTFLALGFATKQSTLFYVPLVVVLGIVFSLDDASETHSARAFGGWLLRLALPLLVCVALLMFWDAPRGPERSFWALNVAHNMPDRWIRSAEVVPRLVTWGFWLSMFTGSPVLNLILLVLGGAGLGFAVQHHSRCRAALVDLVLVGFALAYLGLLWLRAFNTYDRYVSILLAPLALLAARGIQALLVHLPRGGGAAAILFIVVLSVVPLHAAFKGWVPVGGDKGRVDGIDRVAEFLNTMPAGTQVCYHWLGWELDFYLGPEPPVEMVWYPRPGALAGALVPGEWCYLPVPAGAPVERWLRAGDASRVFKVDSRQGQHQFSVYLIRKS